MTMGYGGGAGSGSNVAGSLGADSEPAENTSSGLSGALNQISGGGTQVIGPNAAAYNQVGTQAGNNASTLYNMGYGYKQAGPQINNAFQGQSQGSLSNLQSQENAFGDTGGTYNAAIQNANTASTDQAIAAQTAMARSTQGGASQQAGAMRQAQENAAMQTQQGANNAAQLGSQMALTERGQNAGVLGQMGSQLLGQYGIEQGTANAQGQLDSANQSQQNAMQLGMIGAAQGAAGQQMGNLNSYTQGSLAAQGQQEGNNQAATQQGIQLAQGVVGAAAAASDVRLKTNISPQLSRDQKAAQELSSQLDDRSLGWQMAGTAVQQAEFARNHPMAAQKNAADAFMESAAPATYDYKNPAQNGGQRRLGPMADNLAQGPTGPDIVKVDPKSGMKMVEIAPLALAAAGATSRLNEVRNDHEQRLSALESGNQGGLSSLYSMGQNPDHPSLEPQHHGIVSAYDGVTELSDSAAKKNVIFQQGMAAGAAQAAPGMAKLAAPGYTTPTVMTPQQHERVMHVTDMGRQIGATPEMVQQHVQMAMQPTADDRIAAQRAAFNQAMAHPFSPQTQQLSQTGSPGLTSATGQYNAQPIYASAPRQIARR